MHATGFLLALILDVQYSTAACRSASPLGDELNQADYERDQAALMHLKLGFRSFLRPLDDTLV